jgi:hypothetical protein
MAVTPCVPTQAKQDLWDGVHQPGDTYMAALFTSAVTLDATYATYSPTGEAAGQGYVAGGLVLSGRVTGQTGTVGWITFTNPTWPNSTITARALVIYNLSRANRVLVILDFGQDSSNTNGNFSPQLPAHVAEIA